MNKNSKINPRALASALTISTLICVFVAFCIGTFGASMMGLGENLNWAFCAPHLVFMILAFFSATAKFILCTIPLKKEYSSKDTIKVQFGLEIVGMIVLLFGCLTLAFMGGNNPTKVLIAPILISSLVLAVQLGCAGLAYHNYR